MGDSSLDVVQCLDSLDEYLILLDSLSSTLRQGWLDLASARHSMGTSRVTSAVFDLRPHPAAAALLVKLEEESVSDVTAEVEEQNDIIPCLRHHSFTLSKWESIDDGRCSPSKLEPEGHLRCKFDSTQLRCRASSQSYEDHQTEKSATDEASVSPDAQVQEQRSKLLSVYGVLVSPKLRCALISFETALETIVKLANARSRMVAAFERIQRDMEDLK